ncbi:acyl carrier protein [Streptomyces sp. NPDC012825]|uniref:acyl carrier protein n=1 Tax=Streptomyces sp. NPDC012825 TaxID=3364851 RepID=UPI0036748048
MSAEDHITRELTAIWREVLELDEDEVDPEEFLFEVGGTSLQAVQLMTRIREAFGVEIELAVIYAEGSVGRLSELVEEGLLAGLDGLTPEEALRLLQEETARAERTGDHA